MLKKWLKKRRSSASSKRAADGGFEASISSDINTTTSRKQKVANRLLRTGSGMPKKGKKDKKDKNRNKSPSSRRSSYKNIEKEGSRLSFSHPHIIPIMRQSATSANSTSPPSSTSNFIRKISNSTVDNGVATSENGSKSDSGDGNDHKISKMKIIAAIDRHGEKKERTPAKIKPIQAPRDRPRTSIFKASSAEQRKEAPPPPAAEMVARDMSLVGVASFPSIDTALFGQEGGEDEEDPVGVHYGDILSPSNENDSPPSIIQAVRPVGTEDQEIIETEVVDQNDPIPRALKDEDLLSGRDSQSCTGSRRLQAWINEVNQSIHGISQQDAAGHIDRYHLGGDKTIAEEKSDKDVSMLERIDHRQALLESQHKIEQSLRDTIQKSKARTPSPKGILKVKTVKDGSVQSEGITTDSSGDSLGEPVFSEESSDIQLKRTMAVRPIKVFSKSRRQRLREGSVSTEDEATASIASQSSSDSDIAYETLRQIHPSISRDDTQKTKESVQASLFHQICDIGEIMEDYEADLCQNDDAVSITDDTIASRSTVSKDSFAAHTGGWLCFSPY